MFARVVMLATVLVVSGCSAAAGPSRDTSSPPSSSEQPSAVPTAGSIDLPQSTIDPVVAEIARVAGVPSDQVIVVSAQAVTFPDGSLGCPVPGMAYTQIVVDGYKIVAKVGSDTYDYRGTGSTFTRCQNGAG